MYQIPRQLTDLDAQAANGQLIFRASTPSDAGTWQYRLYLIAPDSPDAGFDEQGRPLLVAVSGDGSIREVAGPRTLKHEQWAEEVFDGLWDAVESSGPPDASSVETWLRDLEQSLVDHITSGTPPARQPLDPGPEAPDGEREWQEPPQAASDLVPGETVAHVHGEVAARPHPDEVDDDDLVEAVVVSATEGSVTVQDLDADDEPYAIDPRQIVLWQPVARAAELPRFRPQSQDDLAPSGPLARIRANIAAIRTLAVLREENRPASAAEQAVLARWSSWGAVPQIFDPRRPELAGLRAELRGLLSEEEWYAAEATTRNAHFTDLSLVAPVWEAVADLGFTGGRVLEPGSGSGNFIALAPDGAQMTGVELDPVTAAIAAALYPDAEIRAESFADTRMPDGYYDLAVGNVPFDEVTITDPVHNPLRLATHNAVIVKALDLVRPGGLVAVLTSRWTMDSTGTTARMEIADRADLVGAVRLPAGAHRKAAGTDALTDLLILRRRDGNPPQTPPDWVSLAPVQIDKDTSVLINRHFAQHPEMVLGDLGTTSTPYGRDDVTVRPRAGVDLPAALGAVLAAVSRQARESGLVMSASPDAVQRAAVERRAERMRQAQEAFGADLARFEGTLVDQGDGTFLQVVGGEFDDRPVYQNAVEELRALLGLRDVYIELLSAESAAEGDQATVLRGRLNDRYDSYVRYFGFLNDRETRRDRRSAHGAFRTDPYAAGVYALEIYDKDSRTARKSDIFVKPAEQPKAEQTTADTPQDALAITLNTFGKVELSEIARLLGDLSLDEARERLGDLVFNEPGSGRLIPAAEYLSGNVRTKLEHVDRILAMVSDEMRPRHPLQANRAALRRVLPKDKQPGDIGDVEIGATWIKPEYYTDFIRQLLQSRYVTVTRDSGADWEVQAPSGVRKSRAATQVYGTKRRDAVDLFERMLRRGSLVVRPPKPEEDASEQAIQDGKRWAAEQTEQAVAKADELNRLFADWIWQDPARTKDLLVTYNKLHNSYVPYAGDGAHLTFPGLSDTIVPLPHQRAAVARALVEPYGSFFDHEVGAGKTYSIAMTLMEMKRLGMVRKPAIVVKNSTIGDFRNDFLKAYRKARVLAIDSAEFTKETAAAYVAQIANGDWDAVILPQSLFKRIPVSGRGQQAFVAAETAEYRARIHKVLTGDDEALSPDNNPGGDPLIGQALEAAAAASADVAQRDGRAVSKDTVKKLQGDLKRHTARAEKNLVKQSAVGISWEQTGIDFLAIDEVQDFANGEIGANNSELALTVSAQSKDLKVKLRTMFRAYGRKVGLGATGTPFPNAMPQAFVMLNYFRPDLLEAAEVSAFSSFQAQYLQQIVAPEISPEGVPRIKERIGAFRNAAMFSHSLWRVMADVRTKQDLNLPVPDHVSETVVVPATEADRLYMAYIAERAEEIRGGAIDPSADNLLKISNDGRLAAMDLRMVGEIPDGPGKLDAAAEKIAQIWEANRHRAYTDREGNPSPLPGALQLVFADRGTASEEARKDGRFIAYDYLREELVKRGIPEDQIRYAQDARNAEEKEQLFADARLGKVAVLIGSTDTMGVGVNVQDRAIALHHLDCPWRPSDVTQREGRLVRQYNQHFKMKVPVQIYRWVKEGSFDSFMWQTVERKARFIDQVRTGRELEEQEAALDGDLGKDYLEFGEIKAIATGNPLMLKKLQSDEEVRQLEAAYKSWRRTNQHLRQVVDTGDETLAAAQGRADLVQRALQARTDTKGDAFRMELASGQVVTKRSEAATALRTGLELLRRQMRGDVSAWEHVATVAGQRFEARINAFHDFIEFSIRGLRDIPGATFTVDDIAALLGDSKSPLGLVTRMENQAERLTELHGRLVGVVEELRQEIDRAQKLVDQPFTKQEKLRRARAEQARLAAEIEAMSTGREQYEDPDRPTAVGSGGGDGGEGMSLADMALHDAEVMARELGGVGVVIQDGEWYGTAAGENKPPTGADLVRAEESDLALPDDGRTALVLSDEELPVVAVDKARPFTSPEEAEAVAEHSQALFRAWARTNTSRIRLADANSGLRRPSDTPPNQVTALHEAYFHALRYRGKDPVEWARRYLNVVAQARRLAHALRTREMSAAEALDVEEELDIEVLDRVSETLTQTVARTLATRAFGPATGGTPPAPRRSASADGREAAPYADRAEYWAAEQALVSAYLAWNRRFGRRLDGTDAERALAGAAESFVSESSRTRAARLLRLDHVLDPALVTRFARRLRTVGEQWDREQRGSQEVDSTWDLYKAVREHAARYADTVDDPQVYQQWLDDVEPITVAHDDQNEEQFVPDLRMDSRYTITGPAGERAEPILGVYLDEAIGQLLAEGMTVEDGSAGLVLSGPQGRFEVTPTTTAGDAAPNAEGNTPAVAEETAAPDVPDPADRDLEPAGSSLAQARQMAVLLGNYGSPADLVAASKLIGESIAAVRHAIDTAAAGEAFAEFTAAADAVTAAEQVDPAEVFAAYDRLAGAAAGLAEAAGPSDSSLSERADRLAQRTHRHLGRMHATGRDLVDVLLDAASTDPEAMAVLTRTDPLKERPAPYDDSGHLHVGRSLVFDTYDRWPEIYSSTGGEATDQLRGAMWNARQSPDTALSTALPDWMLIVSHALGAIEETDNLTSRSVLRDVAQRAYQHHQALAAHQAAAADSPPYGPDRSYADGMGTLAGAFEVWLATATGRDLVERADRTTDSAPAEARAALEEVRQALYAAEWATTDDGSVDDVTRRTTRLAHTTYALVLTLREGAFRATGDDKTLNRLVRTAYEHAASTRAAAAGPDGVEAIRTGLARRQEHLRAQGAQPPAADRTAASTAAPVAASAELEIEHHYRGTVVRGTTNEPGDAAVRAALDRHEFRFSRKQQMWYLPRRMVHANRDAHVRALLDEFSRLGRTYRLLEQPQDQEADREAVIPAGEPYTSAEEARADFEEMFGAYWRMKDTPAGKRLISRGTGARPDGEAVHRALEDLRQGPVGSSRDPFEHPADDVVRRSVELARTVQTLARNLEEERYRAPVAMRHFRAMTSFATQLASRATATAASEGLWDRLFSEAAEAAAPDAPASTALESSAQEPQQQPEEEPEEELAPVAASEATRPVSADALVSGPYTNAGLLEAVEDLHATVLQAAELLPASPQPEGPPGPPSGGPEEWFRGRARLDIPDGYAPSTSDTVRLRPGDVVREGFKRWPESRRLSYRTLVVTAEEPDRDGYYYARPSTRLHPTDIVAVPADSRLLTGAEDDRYTLRHTFDERWQAALQAGRAAADGDQLLSAAVEAYREASAATTALTHALDASLSPSAREALSHLTEAAERHLVRLTVSYRIEQEAAAQTRPVPDAPDRDTAPAPAAAADESSPDHKRAALQAGLAGSRQRRIEQARDLAVRTALADETVRAWFTSAQPEQVLRERFREWLRVTRLNSTDDLVADRFADYFTGAAEEAVEEAAGEVFATVHAAFQDQQATTTDTAAAEPREEDQAPPARAARLAEIARANGWTVAGSWSDYIARHYELTLHAQTAHGSPRYVLTWELQAGRYTYNAQRSASYSRAGRVVSRPTLADVELTVQEPALAPGGTAEPAARDSIGPSVPAEQDTLFDTVTEQEPQEPTAESRPERGGKATFTGTPLTQRHLDALPQRAERQPDRVARLAVVATLRLPGVEIRDALLLLSNIEADSIGEDPIVYGAQITPHSSPVASSLDAQFLPDDLLAMPDTHVLPLSTPIPWSTVERLVTLEPHQARLALPLGEPLVPARPRFTTTGQLRTHFKAAPMPHLSDEARRDLAELADQPGFALSPNGQFALVPEGENWALLAAGSGIEIGRVDEYAYLLGSGIETALAVMGGLPSLEDAVAFSERLAALRDQDGDLIPWEEPRLAVNRAVYGYELDRLVLRERAAFDHEAGRDASTSQALLVWSLIAPREDGDTAPDGQIYADQLEAGDRVWFDADDEYRIREVVEARPDELTELITVTLAALIVAEDGTLTQESIDEWNVPRNMPLHAATPEEIRAEAGIVAALVPGTTPGALARESAAPSGQAASETAEPVLGQKPALPADADATPDSERTALPGAEAAPEQEIVITPDGPGTVMASDDGDLVLVTTETGTRVWSRSELHRPGDPTPLSSPDADVRGRKNDRDREQAATHEGIELAYTDGNRLRDLDIDAGHGTIVDSGGEVIGWVRARIGDDGRRYWWAQDAAGGPPEDPFPEGLPPSAGVPAIRAAGHVRDTMPLSRPHHVAIPPDSAAREIRLTTAQVRELRLLALDQPPGGDVVEPPEWRDTHRRYVMSVAQMRALANAAWAAATTTGGATAGQRRRQQVLLGAVERLDAEQYDTARRYASIPPIGTPDPYAGPYQRQPRSAVAAEPPTEAELHVEQEPVPADPKNEENAVATDEDAAGAWSSRILITTDDEGTFVTGTGGDFFQQERELRELLKKKGQNFAFRDGRWRYVGRAANRARALEEIRAYLRAKDAEEATAAAVTEPAVEYPPTAQQQAIIDAVMARQDVAVQALAGTGKTSTMLMLARRMPEKRIAYIAFNRSIADEAKRKFPRNVTADTSHGFARRVMVNTALRTKTSKAGRNGGAWHRPADLAQALGITAPLRYRGGKIDPEDVARIVKEAIVRYRESADQEIEAHHLGAKWARTPAARALLDVVRRAWADIADPNSNNVLFSHDDYLKLWALTNPRLNYDLIIFDEAQDINPVLKRVIEDQTVQTVVVGDSHQAIYEFRGAIDALRDWPADVVLPLTQSWRFGPDVAALGNAYLQLLGSDLVLEGNPALSTSVGPVQTPDAVLSRTNVGAIGAVFAGFEAGRRVALVGGGRDIEEVAKAAQDLQRGRRTKHPELATFASWSEVRSHAEEEGDKSLQMFVRLVDKYTAEGLIGMIRDLVPEDAKSEETRPDVIVSTAHKAKGREWDNVRIADDFPQPKEDEITGELVLDPGELRLAYVTVTRAKGRLELGSLDWIRTFNAPGAATPIPAATAGREEAVEVQPESAEARQDAIPRAEPAPVANAEQQSTGKEARTPRVSGPTFADVTLSEDDQGQLIVAVSIIDGDGLARSVTETSAAQVAGLQLPLTHSLPPLARRGALRETLVSDEETAAWLGKHISTGPLAPAWESTGIRQIMVGTLRDAMRNHLAPSVEDIAAWLVTAAHEHEQLMRIAQANDQTTFTVAFGGFADELMDGASELLLWGYMTGQRRSTILEQAAPMAYQSLRALPAATAPDTPLPDASATPEPADAAEESESSTLAFEDGEEREATPEEVTELLTGLSAADGTPYLDIYNESQSAAQAAPDARAGEAARPDPEAAGSDAATLAPLPWDDNKIGKRAEAGTKRAQSAPIPQLARQVGDALGLTMARVVWELDHPTDQFHTNLEHTLAGLSDSEQPIRQLVAEVAAELEQGITHIAERAAAHYAALIEPARAEPSRLAAVDEQLMRAARSPEFDNPYIREAMILVMRSIDQAERTARQRRLKPAAVRNALDQVAGLAGSVSRGEQRVPLMHDILAPVLVQVDAARESLASAGLPSTVATEYARLRSLIAEYEQRQDQAHAGPAATADTEPSATAASVAALTDADIAAAILRFDEHAFGRLIFDIDADRPRRPEAHGVHVPLTSPEASSESAAEKGLLYANQSGMEMTVSADGVAVRAGKLSWAKAIAWLRPALTSRRRDLVSAIWTTGNRFRSTEEGFTASGERQHYIQAVGELDGYARALQQRIVDDALGAHRSGLASVLAAHNSAAEQGTEDALITLDEIIDGSEMADREAEERTRHRVQQLRAVLPERHSVVRELRDVQPGDLFLSVSAQRRLFLARSGMSAGAAGLSVDGVLIGPDGATSPYTWSESWWTPETRLQPLLLPDSLAELITLPGEYVQSEPETAQAAPARTQAAPVPSESAAVEPAGTETQPPAAPAAPASARPTAASGIPLPERPLAAPAPQNAPTAQPVAEPQTDTQAVGYQDLEELLHDLVETDRLHAVWASSPTGRLLLAEAQELREETGFADATEAARVDTAVTALLATVDSTRARSSLLLGAYRNVLTAVADAGRSLGGRQAFQSSSDRELLLDLYIAARDQVRRLEATGNLQRLLDGTADGAWLLTRYRRRQEEPLSAPRAVDPDTPTQDRSAGGAGEPATGQPGEDAAVSEPEVLASADPAAATATPVVRDEPASLASPPEVFGSFDFWRDVIGDDLVVGGVVYDSALYEPDGEGGVRRRGEEQNEPWPSWPAEQEDQARIEEAGMATPVVDSSGMDYEADDDLDRAFEDAIALLKAPEPPAAETEQPTALNPAEEQRIRDQYAAVRQALSPVLTGNDAEPVTAEPVNTAVESSDAADLDAAMDNARAEVGYYWGTPEWSAIRTINQAARDFRAAVREAAFDYAQNTLSDIRTNGLDRTIQARTARAVSNISLALARRLERSGQRDTRGWRAVWGLHRAAATRADRLTGNLPADQRIDLATQLRRAWQWLTQRITGTELDAPQTASEGLAAPLAGSMSAIRRLYEALAERLGGLAEHPIWRRIASVWAAGRTLVDRVRMGTARMMADRQSLGTLRMLWVRTLEIISHGARSMMNRLDAGGERDGLRWNLLRVLRHAAEDHIAQAHGHLAPGTSTPLGNYEQAGPDASPEMEAPVTSGQTGSEGPRDQASEDRFRDVVLEVAKSAFTLPMDLMYHLETHRVPYAEAVSMLERMEEMGIVDAVRNGVREVLVTPERAREILDNLPTETRASQPEPQPQQRHSLVLTATETEQPTGQPTGGTETTELPQRRRAKAPGEPSRIAAAAAARSAADPAQRSDAPVTRDQFLAQASRLRQRAEFARATATTPAEERRADILNKIADRAEQSADDLSHGPGIERAPTSGRVAVTAEAFIAALQVHAQARGEQIPNGLLEGAMRMAVDAGRQPPRAGAAPTAASPRSRREADQRRAEQHGQERSSAPSGVRRR